MCSGLKILPRFLLFLLVTGLLMMAERTEAQPNFNIISLTNHVPLPFEGKSYGDVWAENDIACMGIWLGYSSGTPYGVGIYSITNPSSPQLLSVYTSSDSAFHNQFEQGVVRNKIGYFATWRSGGVHIVSLTNPSSPVRLSRITHRETGPNLVTNGFDGVHTLFLERDFLYEAAHSNNIQSVKVFNVANPHTPVYVRDITTTNTLKVHQITTGKKGPNTILYTSGWGTGSALGQTDIWDVTEIASQPAQWLGRIFSGPSSHSSWPTPDGNSLVVCRETTGGEVTIYDISNPALPVVQSIISPASMGLEADLPHNPVIVSNLLFVSWYQNGIQVFDIADRTKPIRIGSYDTYPNARTGSFEGNWGVYPFLGLNKVLLSDIQTGFWIVNASGVLTGTNNYAPLIVQSPISQTVFQGNSVTFTPVITGSSLNYQWKFNGTNISGATASSFTIASAQPFHSGNYTVSATNAFGAVISVPASLSVSAHASAPVITAHPQPQSVYPEQSATFTVAVTGEAPFFYQWRFKGNHLLNATNASYTIPIVQVSHAGDYSVMITNAFGATISSNAMLSIIDSPYINSVIAHPGLQSAVISWNTTLPTDAKVDFGPVQEGSITGSSPRDSVLSTNHSIFLTGLQPGIVYNYQVISRAGGTNYVSGVYQFTTGSSTPIILDNTDPRVTYFNSWSTSVNQPGYFGSNYRAANVSTFTGRYATFTPEIPTSGKYDIDAWHTIGIDRASSVPFVLSYRGGSAIAYVNQQINNGQWVPVATQIPFSRGTTGFVRITNNATGGSVVIADAVRFTYSINQEVPIDGSVPTWWSDGYFSNSINPTQDHDGDGFTTGQEYILGTSPTSANHKLNVRVFRSGGSANVLFHPMHSDRTYTLQQRSNLSGAAWEPVEIQAASAGPDGDGVFSLSLNNATQKFYRVSVALSTNAPAPALQRIATGTRRMFVGAAAEPGCGPTRIYAE